jgi:hypothetical protein
MTVTNYIIHGKLYPRAPNHVTTVFEYWAESAADAEEQHRKAHPECKILKIEHTDPEHDLEDRTPRRRTAA